MAVDGPLVVEGAEALGALEELPLGPAEVVGLDVHGAGVLVLELALAHRTRHRQVLLARDGTCDTCSRYLQTKKIYIRIFFKTFREVHLGSLSMLTTFNIKLLL